MACWLTSSPTLVNNVIHSNTAGSGNGHALFCKNGVITVANSIIWDNESAEGSVAWVEHTSTLSSLTISHSNLESGQSAVYVAPGDTLNWNTGMIDSDPLFVDSQDFHLTLPSPCVNSGDDSVVSLIDADFEGDTRVVQGAVDMGADEYYYHLYTVGTITAGAEISIRVVGRPDAPVRLCQGNSLATPQASKYGDFHLQRPLVNLWNLGTIPSNGVLILSVTIPDFWDAGDSFHFQSLVGNFGGAYTRLTNVLDIVVE